MGIERRAVGRRGGRTTGRGGWDGSVRVCLSALLTALISQAAVNPSPLSRLGNPPRPGLPSQAPTGRGGAVIVGSGPDRHSAAVSRQVSKSHEGADWARAKDDGMKAQMKWAAGGPRPRKATRGGARMQRADCFGLPQRHSGVRGGRWLEGSLYVWAEEKGRTKERGWGGRGHQVREEAGKKGGIAGMAEVHGERGLWGS